MNPNLAVQFVIFSGLVYTVLEFLKPVYDRTNHKWNFDKIAALVLGVAASVLAPFNILALAGITFAVPFVGEVLTGIMVGGSVGAGLIHDFPDFFKALFGVGSNTPVPPVG